MNGIEIVSTGYAKIEKTLDNQQLVQDRHYLAYYFLVSS